MASLVLLSSIFIVAYGLPEPPSAYQYSSPENSNTSSYAAPLGSVGPLPAIKSVNVSESSSKNSSTPVIGSTNSTIKSGSDSKNKVNASVQTSSPSPDQLFNESISKFGGIIHKHVYVNLPPPEIEVDRRAKVQVKLPPPQKNYKILFIRPPSAPAVSIANIPQLRQDEEKTLVYVLVKNLEKDLKIELPTAAPTRPSRPEVHFINYKLQREKSGISEDKENHVFGAYGSAESTGYRGGVRNSSKKSALKSSSAPY